MGLGLFAQSRAPPIPQALEFGEFGFMGRGRGFGVSYEFNYN